MTTARSIYGQPPELSVVPPQKDWPTMYDLPSEDPQEPGLPDEFHALQPQLLSATLQLSNVAKDRIFTGMDMNLYYDLDHPLWHKRPDWFMVTDVPRLYANHDLRLSYVVWDEQVVPNVIVELLSPGTQTSDLGKVKGEPDGTPTKWQVYEQILKVPYYIVYDRYKERWWVFKRIADQYQQQPINHNTRYWLSELNIGLGLWQGEYQGITRQWLRWYNADENWLLTEAEQQAQEAKQANQRAEQANQKAEQANQRAEQANQRAEQANQRIEVERHRAEVERQRAEVERQRAEQLAERLRVLGIDPSEI